MALSTTTITITISGGGEIKSTDPRVKIVRT